MHKRAYGEKIYAKDVSDHLFEIDGVEFNISLNCYNRPVGMNGYIAFGEKVVYITRVYAHNQLYGATPYLDSEMGSVTQAQIDYINSITSVFFDKWMLQFAQNQEKSTLPQKKRSNQGSDSKPSIIALADEMNRDKKEPRNKKQIDFSKEIREVTALLDKAKELESKTFKGLDDYITNLEAASQNPKSSTLNKKFNPVLVKCASIISGIEQFTIKAENIFRKKGSNKIFSRKVGELSTFKDKLCARKKRYELKKYLFLNPKTKSMSHSPYFFLDHATKSILWDNTSSTNEREENSPAPL